MSFNEGSQLDPSQLEDRRGRGGFGGLGGGGFGSGGGGGMPVIVGGGGGLSLILLVLFLLFGGGNLLGSGGTDVSSGYSQQVPAGQIAGADGASNSLAECRTGSDANRRDDCRIVGFVNSIQEFWNGEFRRAGRRYQPAPLVLFSGVTPAGCGTAQTATGPFYCPVDGKVYMDLTFFRELQQRFGAQAGPFAQGYVVAHEYGHHVQDLLGLLNESPRSNTRGAQGSSVRTELQADCFAGLWARHAAETGYLRPPTDAEINDALSAAAAVGDDRIQKATQGRVVPDAFTHGSAQQRTTWFRNGHTAGNVQSCDTSRGQV